MRSLNLDFVNRHRRARQIGYVLLALALMGAIYVLHAYVKRSAELEDLENQLRRMQKTQQRNADHGPSDPVSQERMQAELKAAAKVIERLSLPWDGLFNALEQTTGGEVALLAVEPDADKREVRITAEAKDLQSMLDYAKRLQSVALFKDAHVTSHQIQQQDPQHPVRFVVNAQWIDSPKK
jgi:Tfp pilus assembly protein PilN